MNSCFIEVLNKTIIVTCNIGYRYNDYAFEDWNREDAFSQDLIFHDSGSLEAQDRSMPRHPACARSILKS